jgi:soluble lytic murein transglycosylase-like protein
MALRYIGAALIAAAGALIGLARSRQAPAPVIEAEPQAAGEGAGEPITPAPAVSTPAPVRAYGRLTPADVAGLVDPAYGVPVSMALAYVEVESSFDPTARRFEPRLNEASWGLMQVLESTARDRGWTGAPTDLWVPEIGMRIGLAHVAWTRDYLAAAGVEPTPVAVAQAYNVGAPGYVRGRRNPDYARKWEAAWSRYMAAGF